jgi:ATP-dependent exoDNAse (exonuclease V) alpha subunit
MDKYTGSQLSIDEEKKNIVPFSEYVDEDSLNVNGETYMRWQIPLIVAYSITTHKSQSMTAHNGIAYEPSLLNPFTRGLAYVALSRATEIEKVTLLSPLRTDHIINNKFEADNQLIAYFYYSLNKNFNTNPKVKKNNN